MSVYIFLTFLSSAFTRQRHGTATMTVTLLGVLWPLNTDRQTDDGIDLTSCPVLCYDSGTDKNIPMVESI